MEAVMIKITNLPDGEKNGFTIAHRKEWQDAWVPVCTDTIKLDFVMSREIANNMHELSKEGVTHFINNGWITFFRGNNHYYVMNGNVHTLKMCAELIEARLTKVSEVL
ncbi:MAG: hypothetical protein HZB12_00165 [Candidatus Yonathbacteria bacterium]|nr:hypothetical protein [Candidatus Yonathbacteria bacterium]